MKAGNTKNGSGFKVEHVPLSAIKPHSRNYRKHPPDQLEHLIHSIETHGWYRPIVVANDSTILAGHGVHEAARKMKLKEVPIIRLPWKSDEPRALKLLAGDNEISKLVEIDDRALTEMLQQLEKEGEDLLGTGFDTQQLQALLMLTRQQHELTDVMEHWVGMPEVGAKKQDPRIVVFFRNKQDREKFCKQHGLKTVYKVENIWTVWWPEKKADDLRSVKFVDQKSK